jgi:type IV secretion system protein VirD4
VRYSIVLPLRRSTTASDQRRSLMLPQELMQLPADALLVLKAGLPPTRGRKIVYYRERAFTDRQRPPPEIPVAPRPSPGEPVESDLVAPHEDDAPPPLEFDAIVRAFAEEGVPPPRAGASEEEVGDWLDRMVDAAVPPVHPEREP